MVSIHINHSLNSSLHMIKNEHTQFVMNLNVCVFFKCIYIYYSLSCVRNIQHARL